MIYIAGQVFETSEEAKEFVKLMAPADASRWFILAIDPGEVPTAPKGLATDIVKALGEVTKSPGPR